MRLKHTFFQGDKPAKRILTFNEYMDETMVIAKRKKENEKGEQRYTSAQLEIALVCFCDFEALKSEIDPDIHVLFPQLTIDYQAGFDWLDLSVSNNDQDAIAYFQRRLLEADFAKSYLEYKYIIRPECALRWHETDSFAAIETMINLDNVTPSRISI